MNAPSPTRIRILWACTAATLVLLGTTYTLALVHGELPKGHPWHGIALAALAGFFAIQTVLHRPSVIVRVIAMLLPLVAMGAMLVALDA